MIYLLAFVALVLATARATRTINIDEVATPIRSWIINKTERPPTALYRFWLFLLALIRCYWCSGFWVSLLTTNYTLAMITLFTPLQWWQAAAAAPILTLAVAYSASWVLDKEEGS